MRFYSLFSSVFIVLFAVLLLPGSVFSHSFGPSLEKEVGEYLVDIGYESDPIVAGESTTFALELYEKGNRDPVQFRDIWVRLERGEQTIFATALGAGFTGQPTMIFTFPTAGEHTLYARFQDDDSNGIVEVSFPLTVVEEEGNSSLFLPILVTTIIIIMSGAIFGFVALKGVFKSKESQKV